MTRGDLQEYALLYWAKVTLAAFFALIVLAAFLGVALYLLTGLGVKGPWFMQALFALGGVWGLAALLGVLLAMVLVGAALYAYVLVPRLAKLERDRMEALVGDAATLPEGAWGDDPGSDA